MHQRGIEPRSAHAITAFKAFLDSASVKVARQSYTEQLGIALSMSMYLCIVESRHQPRPCITWTEYESVTSTDLDRGYTYLDTAETRGLGLNAVGAHAATDLSSRSSQKMKMKMKMKMKHETVTVPVSVR
ncbi:hypothetical protein C8R45DRAFT_934217 [Mycena sanguinolenta]|nr:hypothetical protein C8R45DRAFT_934217 [Mycena sanguinolenta]